MNERIAQYSAPRGAGGDEGPAAVEWALDVLFGSRREQRRGAPSVYEILLEAYGRCDPEGGDYSALKPAARLNEALSCLVTIVQSGSLAHRVHARLLQDRRLLCRAHELRTIAGHAEAQLEHHHSEQLCDLLRAIRRGGQSQRTLASAFASFPYLRNYQQLVAVECALLASEPRVSLLPAQVVRALSPQARPPSMDLSRQLFDFLRAQPPLSNERPPRIAVCGCGPLPLTGLLLHEALGAEVELIERDAAAATRATELIELLGELGLVEGTALRVRCADAAALDYRRSHAEADTCVRADVVLVASLVPDADKHRLAMRIEADKAPGPALLVRSARGLCAELAYEAVATAALTRPGLSFCGESRPLSTSADSADDVRVWAPAEVLNTTELYCSLPQLALRGNYSGAAPPHSAASAPQRDPAVHVSS